MLLVKHGFGRTATCSSAVRSPSTNSHARGIKVVVRAAGSDGQPEEDRLLKKLKSLPLSLFMPYKNLPKPGQIVDEEELKCDSSLYNCRTPVYVYEEKCASCCSTGYVRRRSGGRGGRGHSGLHKCLMCTGMGYVRLTTSRYEPDVPVDDNDLQFSVARTLPGSESKQNPKFDPLQPPG